MEGAFKNTVASGLTPKSTASQYALMDHGVELVENPKGYCIPLSTPYTKRLRRTLKNREYSLNYGPKQLQYIIGLEAKVEDLQAEVKINSPRIEYSARENSLLTEENFSMKQKLCAMSGELVFKEAQYEELKKERERLKQSFEVYQKQLAELFTEKL